GEVSVTPLGFLGVFGGNPIFPAVTRAEYGAVVCRDPTMFAVREIHGQQINAHQNVIWLPGESGVIARNYVTAVAHGDRAFLGNESHARKRHGPQTHSFFPVSSAVVGANNGTAIADGETQILVDE